MGCPPWVPGGGVCGVPAGCPCPAPGGWSLQGTLTVLVCPPPVVVCQCRLSCPCGRLSCWLSCAVFPARSADALT